ncbi:MULTISPECIES: DUF5681 domain-containing protein [unclassified Bradyrhizobium]
MVERIRLNSNKNPGATERNATEVPPTKASTDAVGYGKPPEHSQFKPGQSGNPKGRPKGTRNFKTDVREMLQSPVNITKDGRIKSITTQRASLERLRSDALNGNQRANENLLRYGEKLDEANVTVDAPLEAGDQAILDAYVRRVTQG